MTAPLILVPATPDSEWIREAVPWASPAELPLAGQRFIDYAIEGANQAESPFVEILDACPSPRLAADFGEQSRTKAPVFYLPMQERPPKGLGDLSGCTIPFAPGATGDIYVVWGLVLPRGLPEGLAEAAVSEADIAQTPCGFYHFRDGTWRRVLAEGIFVRDIPSWYRANLELLRDPGFYTLPGYSVDRGVHLGRNVVLERGTEVSGPALLQDDTWCARNVRIEGDVIVGSGSFVGEGATLRRTVVGLDTYVGKGLELVDKIVLGKRIFDAETGTWTDIEEPGVAQHISAFGKGWFGKLAKFIAGTSHWRHR